MSNPNEEAENNVSRATLPSQQQCEKDQSPQVRIIVIDNGTHGKDKPWQ